ncbi:glycosyltransferase family 2 protein [Williamsia sterculiae]|uniref:Glycosyltransferase, GT2 family n=1 Tax=Williamsia sterculiae TaxID=1344003 RepID=A0A1N7CID2_9NOCA|nr:glycosyltransferase family 2 protein [Williamsia sterculiae]SIR63237.1 Glycosyltransferase, GT2 family [Williamsia sterculiae]
MTSRPSQSTAALALVCSTIGRPDDLTRLVESVRDSQGFDDVEFVLVDQSSDKRSSAVLDNAAMGGKSRSTVSGRGLSVGRNVGMGLVTAPIVGFPDDNCWYPPETLSKVVELLASRPDLAGVSGVQLTPDGKPSMLRWLEKPTFITRRNFVRTSVSSTLFLRVNALPSSAPFDEGVGAGAPGWRGAGEESDLVLRMLAAGHRIFYDPSIVILQDDDRDDATEDLVSKKLKYGVGMGYLWRRHHLPVAHLMYHALRKMVGIVIRAARGDVIVARSDLAYLRGEVAGWLGREP